MIENEMFLAWGQYSAIPEGSGADMTEEIKPFLEPKILRSIYQLKSLALSNDLNLSTRKNGHTVILAGMNAAISCGSHMRNHRIRLQCHCC